MIKDIHIFSPGVQTSAQGVTREFSKKDLKQVADSYEPEVHEAPIRIGHTDNDRVPSWGWVRNVKMKGSDLYAEVEFSPLMEDYVKNGLYKKVSASFYSPESKINPEPGQWSLRHVAMLGAQPPAVKGLKGFAYSEESFEEGVLDFSTATELKPESVFDEELGPTLKSDNAPMEYLKDKLEEARTEMAKEEKDKAALEATAETQQPEAQEKGPEFAEKKMKKAPAGKQGAEEAEEEVNEDENVDMASCDSKKKKNYKEDSEDHADCPACSTEGDSLDHAAGCKKGGSFAQMKGGKKAAIMDMDEEKHAEAEALRQGKSASVGSAKHDAKMVSTDEESDGSGPEVKKMKKNSKDGSAMQDPTSLAYNEVEVPEGLDVSEYREGFIQAVLAYKEAVLIDGDVEFNEDEETTESFSAGVEAGIEFAESEVIRNGKPSGVGSAKHDDKCCDTDEETDIPGKSTPPAKGPGTANSGANECDDCGEFEESTKMTKRGKDGLVSSSFEEDEEEDDSKKPDFLKKKADKDTVDSKEVFQDLLDGDSESKDGRPATPGNTKPGKPDSRDYKSKTKVKATKTLIHGDDGMDKRPASQDLGRQNDQSGRGETGEAGEEGKTFRARGGKTTAQDGTGTEFARSQKGTDGGAQDKDRGNTGKSKELEEGRKTTGKALAVDMDDRGQVTTAGGFPGSGSAVKKPQVRVQYVGKKGGTTPLTTNFAETEQFSELSNRLAELEAANAKLVQEKIAAERHAHRLQLEDFTESLFSTGRLTNAVIDELELVDYMEGLEYGTLEFAEGESPATLLMDLLAKLPAQVSFSEIAPFNKEEIPLESLDPHERALRISKEEGVDYTEALKKSLFTAE